MTGPEMASILSRVAGATIEYEETPLGAVRALSEDLARMFEWFDRVGYSADVPVLVRDYREVGWHDFVGWGRQQDWSVLNVAHHEWSTT